MTFPQKNKSGTFGKLCLLLTHSLTHSKLFTRWMDVFPHPCQLCMVSAFCPARIWVQCVCALLKDTSTRCQEEPRTSEQGALPVGSHRHSLFLQSQPMLSVIVCHHLYSYSYVVPSCPFFQPKIVHNYLLTRFGRDPLLVKNSRSTSS